MENTQDWKVEFKLTLDEFSNPNKWMRELVSDSLESGEDLFAFSAVPVDEVVDYKKDLIAALEQIQFYTDNDLVIGADRYTFKVSEKLKLLGVNNETE